ncbi:MAG: hypothetical protein FWB74_00420 [Defluviitaleaceae bacterium]|nr:hypothetical protein [Defluviitaleaceae bacterium]
MNFRKILARVMVVVMALGIFSYWGGGQVQLYASSVTVQPGVTFTHSFSVTPFTEGAFVWGEADPGSGIDVIVTGGIGGNFTATINASHSQAGQSFSVLVNLFNAQVPNIVLNIRVAEIASNFNVVSPTQHVDLIAGAPTLVDVTIENSSPAPVSNITLLDWLPTPNPYFTVEVVSPTTRFNLGANARRTVQLRITPRADAPSGVRSVNFQISYGATIANPNHTTLAVPVRVISPQEEEPRIITSFSQPTAPVASGDSFTVTATLENISGVDARNVQLRATGFETNFSIIGASSNLVGTIPAGQTRTVTFTFSPRDTASGSPAINFALTYDNRRDGASEPPPVHVSVAGADATGPRAHLNISAIATPTGQFLAGQEALFAVTITNIGEGVATNISLAATPDAGIVSRLQSTQIVQELQPNESVTLNFAFSPTATASTRFHNIRFTLNYNNGVENRTPAPVQYSGMAVYLPGDEGVTNLGRMQISSVSSPVGEFVQGQEGRFVVTVTNVGEGTARNIRVSTTPDAGLVSRLQSIQTIGTLEPGQSHTFEFAFAPRPTATTGFHNVGFALAYNNGDEAQSTEQFSGMLVYGTGDDEDGTDASTPRIIISDYSVEPLIVMANSEFDLALTIMNTHNTRTVSNILVTWTTTTIPGGQGQAPTSAFTPVGASNAFHIQQISPGGTHEHHMRLFAIPDAPPGHHVIVVSFTYEDDQGRNHEARAEIGVNVRQVTRVNLGDPHISDWQFVGNNNWISFDVHNTSRAPLFNLRVFFEGEGFDVSNASQPFGNFAAGNVSWFQGNLTPIMGGTQTLYLVATWEDATEEQHEYRRAFTVEVQGGMGGGDWPGDGGGFDPFPPMEMPDGVVECPDCGNWVFTEFDDECWNCGWVYGSSDGIPLWMLLTGGGILLAGGVIVTIVIVVNSKRKKRQFGGEQYDELDDL